MKNITKKILVLLLTLVVIIGTVFSLSSCSILDFVSDFIEENTDENKDGSPSDSTTADPGASDGGSSDKTEGASGTPGNTEGDPVEFYPGAGSVSADKISPKNRTLLSTVVIVANFGLSPSAGSGVIYSIDREKGDAYIITNYHVVYDRNYGACDSANLYLYGMRYSSYAISAKLVGGSVEYDIAVLKVEGSEVLKNSYAMAADFGNSEDVRVFDDVFVVGNPEGFGMAVTEGIISVDSESLEMTGCDGSAIKLRVMRVSAAVNEGNSGGGLYDDGGKLIGVVCAKRVGSEVDNIAYAIPSNLAKNLVDNIIYFCDGGDKTTVQRPLIGITITSKVIGIVVDEETGDIVKAELVEVTELTDTCIAKELIQVGDVVNSITVNGVTVKVTRLHHVIDHMLTARVGSEVVLNVTRGGEIVEFSFTVPESAFSSVK